jgi:hypothetical protein
MKLVRREAQTRDTQLAEINRDLSYYLRGVRMEGHTRAAADLGYFRHWLQHARFVVAEHQRD